MVVPLGAAKASLQLDPLQRTVQNVHSATSNAGKCSAHDTSPNSLILLISCCPVSETSPLFRCYISPDCP